MEPSQYQVAIYNAVSGTQDHLMIDAVAGSGKTTTIVEAAKLLPNLRVGFVAFNKHIAEELRRRVPSNVEALTLNAFGWRVCMRNVSGRINLDKDKSFKNFQMFFNMKDRKDAGRFWKWQVAAVRLISLFKAHLMYEPTMNQILELSDKHGIDIPDDQDFASFVILAFKNGTNDERNMDFDDQIFMPIYRDWSIPKYDVGMFDEFQDFSPMNQELAVRMCKRLIGVGDTRQAIYGFRGADPDSIPNMVKRLNATVLPLSICYRCPKKVVAQAKEIVSHIEPSPTAPEGTVANIKLEEFRKNAISDDYVLCRCTAPLVSECLKMIREGRKATVKGKDIGQQIITLIDKVADKTNDLETFQLKLEEYYNDQMNRLGRFNKEAEMQALQDRVDTIKVFIEACDSVQGIKAKINEIFKDEVSGIVFCTVHKSKGLEADRIYILEPKLMPHPMAKQAWQKIQEMNLKYVAITRAKKELLWIQ